MWAMEPTPTLDQLSVSVGAISLAAGVKLLITDQKFWGFGTIALGLLLTAPSWWRPVRIALGPISGKLPRLRYVALFLIAAITINLTCVIVLQRVSAAKLRTQGAELSHDLADFFNEEDKADALIPFQAPDYDKRILERYYQTEKRFAEAFTPRIDEFCNELVDLGLLSSSPHIPTMCETSRMTTAVRFHFGEFRAVSMKARPTIASVVWGTVRNLPFVLLALVVWLTSFIVTRKLETVGQKSSPVKTKEIF